MRGLFVLVVLMPQLVLAQASGKGAIGSPERDSESGAEVCLLGGDERPADDIYGEQPYGDVTGRRIAIRYYTQGKKPGGINILDLEDGGNHEILSGKPPFPAFHAWGEWLYYAQTLDGKRWLRRCNYLSLQVENVAELPPERGSYSYGTVSPDHRYYAVSVTVPEGGPAQVHLLDLRAKQWSVLLNKPGYHAKHEQFSRDGRNRVLIQLNQMPDVKVVLLGELEIIDAGAVNDRNSVRIPALSAGIQGSRGRGTIIGNADLNRGGERLFPADRPYTPRPTGHEAWIGTSSGIFFSTGKDLEVKGNLWRAKVGDDKPTLVCQNQRCNHVSVSRDGKYWIGDSSEAGVPIYIGSFATGRYKRVCLSRTEYDNQQWSHAHPYLTADNKWLIFSARRNGHAQVYGARLKPGWLESL